jgi:hypothetical protein
MSDPQVLNPSPPELPEFPDFEVLVKFKCILACYSHYSLKYFF